ncbi:crossover junction endodeoxyribonuclease RuvC [Luteitalea sp. TBR-22]|uniref:crossover junction endodeoxyribonuclease RuvC n=1 Tax=Luteitalea sp. TBR-22 TaxID=2802971 RepID=UPI001AFB6151|nr:crossover junction endodeoxyribonuclease RuvC [Luteitalea sp. TBR-22]BCS31352.1 crossover junction endodeoxyribonuclease RuvC [Luteitalea sp. TBR-22]
MRIFGIDPGSVRTGYGCIETSGARCALVCSGAIVPPPRSPFPEKLQVLHLELTARLADARPDCVAIESLFHGLNTRSAFALAHARGVMLLAATQLGIAVVEYAPAEVKRAVVGFGRAEKPQVQQMVTMLLGLDAPPRPLDVSDALAVAICHAHTASSLVPQADATPFARGRRVTSWRQVRPEDLERR